MSPILKQSAIRRLCETELRLVLTGELGQMKRRMTGSLTADIASRWPCCRITTSATTLGYSQHLDPLTWKGNGISTFSGDKKQFSSTHFGTKCLIEVINPSQRQVRHGTTGHQPSRVCLCRLARSLILIILRDPYRHTEEDESSKEPRQRSYGTAPKPLQTNSAESTKSDIQSPPWTPSTTSIACTLPWKSPIKSSVQPTKPKST